MMRYILITGIWLFSFQIHPCRGQDTAYARYIINHLCSRQMHGRGYAMNGDHKAARFISHELEKQGLMTGKGIYQFFSMDVNTFPGIMKMVADNRTLVAGRDFLADPSSPSVNGKFQPVYRSVKELPDYYNKESISLFAGKVLIVDLQNASKDDKAEWKSWKEIQLRDNPLILKALMSISDEKLTFSTSVEVSSLPYFEVNPKAMKVKTGTLEIHIRNKFEKNYRTSNIWTYVPGTLYPDSFLLYTAHYDHLGLLGRKTYFPGANDNASGVAMLLSLADYFSTHPQKYSIAFLFFSGEEAGLLGSAYFTEHPVIELSHIKFLINLDLVGTGEDGITVVNAIEFPGAFEKLVGLPEANLSVGDIKKRGYACNSDQCFFYQHHVPCFYIYTRGGIAAYHDVYDRPETLPLTLFPGLTKLLISFYSSQ